MRLVKFLALAGFASRKKAVDLVKQGKVKIKRRFGFEPSPIKLILKETRCSLRARKLSFPLRFIIYILQTKRLLNFPLRPLSS
jgi:hypothetical protein